MLHTAIMSSSASVMPTAAATAGPSNSQTKKIMVAGFALTQVQLALIVVAIVGTYCYHYGKGPFAHHR